MNKLSLAIIMCLTVVVFAQLEETSAGQTQLEPVAAEPVAAEPVAAEPVAAEPVAAEPVAAEPVEQKQTKKQRGPKAKVAGSGNVQKHFGVGVQFMGTGNTRTTNMRYELGMILKGKHYHGINVYHKIYEWDYNVGTVWGINYDYKRRFGTKFIRLDVGLTAGWNLYEEEATSEYPEYRHVRFGGPQADLNLYFGPVQLYGGYVYMMGYQETGDVREYDGSHLVSLGFGIKMKKRN